MVSFDLLVRSDEAHQPVFYAKALAAKFRFASRVALRLGPVCAASFDGVLVLFLFVFLSRLTPTFVCRPLTHLSDYLPWKIIDNRGIGMLIEDSEGVWIRRHTVSAAVVHGRALGGVLRPCSQSPDGTMTLVHASG